MKKVFLFATLVIALTGLTMAQTSPKPAPKAPAKKEAAAPAKETAAKDTTKKAAHHHKKHDKTVKP